MRSSFGSSVAACQSRRTLAPAAASATATSRSQFEPGKVITPACTRSPRSVGRSGLEGRRIGLDHRIGQELLAHGPDLGLGGGAVRPVELELDQLALPDRADALEAELGERAPDRGT